MAPLFLVLEPKKRLDHPLPICTLASPGGGVRNGFCKDKGLLNRLKVVLFYDSKPTPEIASEIAFLGAPGGGCETVFARTKSL